MSEQSYNKNNDNKLMPKILGQDKRAIENHTKLFLIFYNRPSDELSFTELRIESKIPKKQLSKFLKEFTETGIIVLTPQKKYKFANNITELKVYDEFISKILQDETLPVDAKLKILEPHHKYLAYALLIEILSRLTRKNYAEIVALVTDITTEFAEELADIPSNQRNDFVISLVSSYNVLSQSKHEQVYENYLNYLKEQNEKTVGIKKKIKRSDSKASQQE